jgi:hypothetical protein
MKGNSGFKKNATMKRNSFYCMPKMGDSVNLESPPPREADARLTRHRTAHTGPTALKSQTSFRRSSTMQPSHPAPSNELAVLMELRLAFGPGTRLWANSSREDLCYEWLYFKARQSAANLRDFAKALIAREITGFATAGSVCDVRRRVATVLRDHHIKTPRKSAPASPHLPNATSERAPSPFGLAARGVKISQRPA